MTIGQCQESWKSPNMRKRSLKSMMCMIIIEAGDNGEATPIMEGGVAKVAKEEKVALAKVDMDNDHPHNINPRTNFHRHLNHKDQDQDNNAGHARRTTNHMTTTGFNAILPEKRT